MGGGGGGGEGRTFFFKRASKLAKAQVVLRMWEFMDLLNVGGDVVNLCTVFVGHHCVLCSSGVCPKNHSILVTSY